LDSLDKLEIKESLGQSIPSRYSSEKKVVEDEEAVE